MYDCNIDETLSEINKWTPIKRKNGIFIEAETEKTRRDHDIAQEISQMAPNAKSDQVS